MPLRLDLKPHEKLFVGGAVILNGENRSTITVLNGVPILREKDILTDVEATTPCKRIYLSVQLMYMEPASLAKYHQIYWSLVKEVVEAAPSTVDIITTISQEVLAGRYYQALKQAGKLIKYEAELVAHAGQPA